MTNDLANRLPDTIKTDRLTLRAPRLQGHSAIVYAVYSAAGVILAFLAGSVFCKEPLTGRNRLGVAVAVAAVALLNLG